MKKHVVRGRLWWLRMAAALALAAAMAWAALMLVQSSSAYQQEESLHTEVLALRPPKAGSNDEMGETQEDLLVQWQARNPDIVGWLSLPGTPIDYPFVQTENNSDYLRKDLDGNDALSGSIFLDYRCDAEKPGGNTILYGHNMQNDAMFGSLPGLADAGGLAQHRRGEIFLNDQWYEFALLDWREVEPTDAGVYSLAPEGLEGKQVITLSTCASDASRRFVAVGYIEAE